MEDSSFRMMREMMTGIKQLFQTRHYIPCAAVCEGLLFQHDGELHPIHRATLNFYIALSHDALAREAGMRNREEELDMAEKHYVAAIADLDPTAQTSPATEPHSPLSSDADDSMDLSRRPSNASSVDSCSFVSSAATSISEGQDDEEEKLPILPRLRSKSVSFAAPSDETKQAVVRECKPARPCLSPINTRRTTSASVKHQVRLSAHVVSFTEMLKGHLAGVRALKGTTPTYYRSASYTRTSPFGSRRASRDFSVSQLDTEMERIRLQRKNMSFRPRFDPTSVRKLCADALDGL